MNIYALMVIYNSSVESSSVYKVLKNTKNIRFVVCDNSIVENDNQGLVEKDGGIYIALKENGGLAKAYNCGIDRIRNMGAKKDDYVCIFDDDTVIEEGYFEELRELAAAKGEGIYLPLVMAGNQIMSPALLKGLYCKSLKDKTAVYGLEASKLTGINSGMAVKMRVYDDFRYDEAYFMDYIDHDFILKMREKNIYPSIMKSCLKQNFSAITDDMETAKRRFKRQKSDLRLFYGSRTCGMLVYYYVVWKKTLKLLIKYKSIKAVCG